MPNGQPAPAVSPVRTEIQQVLGVREKTAAAIVKAKETRETQESELVKNYAKQFASSDVDPARALDLRRQWKIRDEQSVERIAALEDLLDKTEEYVETLKKEHSAELAAVLKETIQKLSQSSGQHQQQNKELQERIAKLYEELHEIEPPQGQAAGGYKKASRTSSRGKRKSS